MRALINHVVLGNTWAAENIETGSAPRPSGDIIGEHEPVEVYTTSADAMMASFEEPGALGRMVKMPFGEMPGSRRACGVSFRRSHCSCLGSGKSDRAGHRLRSRPLRSGTHHVPAADGQHGPRQHAIQRRGARSHRCSSRRSIGGISRSAGVERRGCHLVGGVAALGGEGVTSD